jgi:hypothetical protein
MPAQLSYYSRFDPVELAMIAASVAVVTLVSVIF